jgi:hypothetical protein
VAGIAATWFTAAGHRKLQLEVQSREAWHREWEELQSARRQLYARFLAAVHKAVHDKDAFKDILLIMQELHLIAGSVVRVRAGQAWVELAELHEAQAQGISHETDGLATAETELVQAMRVELIRSVTGETLPDPDDPAYRAAEERVEAFLAELDQQLSSESE